MKGVFLPNLPAICILSRKMRDSWFCQSILIHDETKKQKPKFSNYEKT